MRGIVSATAIRQLLAMIDLVTTIPKCSGGAFQKPGTFPFRKFLCFVRCADELRDERSDGIGHRSILSLWSPSGKITVAEAWTSRPTSAPKTEIGEIISIGRRRRQDRASGSTAACPEWTPSPVVGQPSHLLPLSRSLSNPDW